MTRAPAPRPAQAAQSPGITHCRRRRLLNNTAVNPYPNAALVPRGRPVALQGSYACRAHQTRPRLRAKKLATASWSPATSNW